jgi:23S rRNA (pseudouridine1915-N3)-methyltransferase
MKWKIITVGKPSFGWVREGVAMYQERLRPLVDVEWVVLRDGRPELFVQASEGCTVLALDERGADWSTAQLAARVAGWEQSRVKNMALWIGGADGLGDVLRAKADHLLCFGRLTLMHELALLLWFEQLYRVQCLNRGHPYHRA